MPQKWTDSEFIAAWNKHETPKDTARELRMSERATMSRRRAIEARYGISLATNQDKANQSRSSRLHIQKHIGRIDLKVENGSVIVFSDAHYWPGPQTTAHRALLAMIRQIKPEAVICNGDAFDGGAISRFSRIGWDSKPSIKDELQACQDRLGEIQEATKGSLIWCLGNHDARFETRLAASAPEYEGIGGFHLKDHFPAWHPTWTCWINDSVLVAHRMRNGIHATHANVQAAHYSVVTGHLHSAKVTPYTDAAGRTKYGVDPGTLAEPMGPQFVDYMEGKHGNWRSGFSLLTFAGGELLMPELCLVWDDDSVQFRGHILDADTLAIR